jgi:hypothetical protein
MEQRPMPRALQAAMIGALAFTEAKELVDQEGPNYYRGFIEGYSHCLKLAGELDALNDDGEYLQL